MDAILLLNNTIRLFVEDKRIQNFEDKLLLNNSRMKNFNGYLKICTIEGIFFMIAVMIAAANIAPQKPELFITISTASFFAPLLLNYLFQDVLFEKRKMQKEELLSDLLLEASVFCDENSGAGTIKRLAQADFPLLQEDFKRAYLEIHNGESVEAALTRMKNLNKSKAFSRVVELFLQGYKSGAKMSEIFKETAEDLLETKAIIKERQAVMLVTKYTLLIASAIIVPAILGLIIGLVSGMDFNAMEGLELGLSGKERQELLINAINGTTIYVIEYALLSSFFLALQEGNKKNFWIYGLVVLPVAIIIFITAKNLG